ncbi:dTDP-4-amino-4,6-dideoxygalactose transaminase [uncultured Limimaricola sp.]|uniref:dTDP-4-amino-4,6-dideoxygalactose transaminase n=1 Tax=uncultured Limimaricola sp. TaxID=2211667 RepID=UPI0030F54BB0
MHVPFNRTGPVGLEATYVTEVMTSGRLGGNGDFTRRAEDRLRGHFENNAVLLTASCTDALELAAILTGIAPGDEVILPSFTFVSTANAFCLRGAVPRFVDIDPITLNLDPAQIEAAITPRTKVIVPVHYAGNPCDMTAILAIATRHGLQVVEDAAQALGSMRDGRPVGLEGALSAISFHETKNVGCGEGGALIVNDPSLIERAHVLRDKGTNRRAFRLGQTEKYSWVDIGSSYAMSELSAAYLLGQLEQLHHVTTRRCTIWHDYHAALTPLQKLGHIGLPHVPAPGEGNGHIFYLLLSSEQEKHRLIAHLAQADVQAVFHYVPLHTSPFGRAFGGRPGDLPVTERISEQLLRLPMGLFLDRDTIDHIVDTIFDFFGRSR